MHRDTPMQVVLPHSLGWHDNVWRLKEILQSDLLKLTWSSIFFLQKLMLATLHISYKGVQKIFEIFVQTFLLKILDIYDDLHYMYYMLLW